MTKQNTTDQGGIGPVRTAALAVGGMVGGGIYVSLGVVVEASGQWAWASFLIAGIAAWLTALSYGRLTTHYSQGGGIFDFLEEVDQTSWAGILSWLLMIGYTLTISVYAYAFGNYVVNSFGGDEMMIRVFIVGILAVMIWLNLLGAGKLTSVEVVIVSGNILILLAISTIGVVGWDVSQLSDGIEPKSAPTAAVGAAAIFVAYEGFQLLTYEYDEMKDPKRWFSSVLGISAFVVIGIYVFVTIGITMIAGAGTVVENSDVALAIAAQSALGLPGLILMTVAAGFATSAAINSTLFSTAKLAARVSRDHQLPAWFNHTNSHDVPYKPIILIACVAGALALLGSLGSLVEAASMIFVGTFACVNWIAAREAAISSWLSWTGFAMCVAIGCVLFVRLAVHNTLPLCGLIFVTGSLIYLRPKILNHCDTST